MNDLTGLETYTCQYTSDQVAEHTFERQYEKSRTPKFCSNEHRYASMKGKVFTTAEGAKKSGESRTGQVVAPETREKISKSVKQRRDEGVWDFQIGVPRTEEVKQKVSQGMVRAYLEGRADPTGYFKNKRHDYSSGERVVTMRSQTEVRFAEKLDQIGISWVYEPRRFSLGWCTYTPDFYLPDMNVWIEVKGHLDELSSRKIAGLRELGYDLRLFMYDEIWGAAPLNLEVARV